eukprot:gene8797-5156_t
MCRESADHAPINTWDRNAFITYVRTGEPSYTSAMSDVSKNFIIANYNSSQGMDTDDGSSWYDIQGGGSMIQA